MVRTQIQEEHTNHPSGIFFMCLVCLVDPFKNTIQILNYIEPL